MTKKSSKKPLPAGNHLAWATTRVLLVNIGQATLPHNNSSLATKLDNFAKQGLLR